MQSSDANAHASYHFGDAWYLQLYGNHSSDSLEKLDAFPNLVKLRAPCPSLSNEDVAIISEYRSIQMLDLRDASIDDACIADLANLDRLVILWINNTEISDAGAERLAKMLPNCDIRNSSGPGPW
ncbi:MAG: hypothetical protein AAF483_27540 [Planctomycetota bacterium]